MMEGQANVLDIVNITTPERVFRTAAGAGALIAVVAGAVATPPFIFLLSILGPYLIQTGAHGQDPVYALAKRLRVADRIQVWQHTLTTAMFLPIVIAGDLISSFIVFCLSMLGGFLATTAMVGRDVLAPLEAWLFSGRSEAAVSMDTLMMVSPRKKAAA